MKAHLIETHLLVIMSRLSAKVKVKYQGHVPQIMGVSGALVFHKHILYLHTFFPFCLDSFLRTRTGNDHEATLMIKTQFMSFWDGLVTNPDCQIIIMGATNRPQDVDAAILRRMPCTFKIGMPVSSEIHNSYPTEIEFLTIIQTQLVNPLPHNMAF